MPPPLKKWDTLTPDQQSTISSLVGLHTQLKKALSQLTKVLDVNRNWQLYLDLPQPPNNTAPLLRDAELRLSKLIEELSGHPPLSLQAHLSARYEKQHPPKPGP